MDKVVVKWQVSNGMNFIKAKVEGQPLVKVVNLAQKFENDIGGVLAYITGGRVMKDAESSSPEEEITTNFYMENGKLTTDYRLTVIPKAGSSLRYIQAVGMIINSWMQDHFARAIQKQAVIMDAAGNVTRKDI